MSRVFKQSGEAKLWDVYSVRSLEEARIVEEQKREEARIVEEQTREVFKGREEKARSIKVSPVFFGSFLPCLATLSKQNQHMPCLAWSASDQSLLEILILMEVLSLC